jgi:hypothetical protein
VLAWLAGNALYWAAADRQGFDYLLVRTHARWDSGNYLNIATHGYTLAHCVPRPTSPFTSGDWCGTVGWFPLYPLGMAARERWTAAGLAGAASAAAYQTGVLLAAVGPIWLLLARRRLGLNRAAALGRAVQTGTLVSVGLLAVMGLQLAETGRWDGFLLVEAKYGTGLHNPAATFAKNAVRQARPLGASGRRRPPGPVPRARPVDPLGSPAAPPPGGRPSRLGAARRGGRLADGRPLLPLRADLMTATCARTRTVLLGMIGSGRLPSLR